MSWKATCLRGLISILLLSLGIGGAVFLVATKTVVQAKEAERLVPLVEVVTVPQETHQVMVDARGSVIPAKQLRLESEVSGKVIWTSDQLIPGGEFKKGELILKLDRRDLETIMFEREAKLQQAILELSLELGRAKIAKKEWALLYKKRASKAIAKNSLALREPQLRSAQATVRAAQSALEKAKRDIDRTEIRAPFACVVTKKLVELGQRIQPQIELATLIGAKKLLVQVALPLIHLKQLTLPNERGEQGAPATVFYGSNLECSAKGKVVRWLKDLDGVGRMARLLVEIDYPKGMGRPTLNHVPLLIGSYVKVKLQGHALSNCFKLPRTLLRDSHFIWLLNSENQLEIRRVDLAWSHSDFVVIKNELPKNHQIVVSRLSAPINGMKLRHVAKTEER